MNKLEGVDLAEYLEFCGQQEAPSCIPMADVVDATWDRINQGPKLFGDCLPWVKTHGDFRLRPGETTIWAGVNGSGKSLMLSQLTAHLCKGANLIVASLEMRSDAIAARFVRQVSAGNARSRDEVDRILGATRGSYWLYDECDSVEKERILGMSIYATKELGCKHVFIDSLVKCGIKSDDYNGQKDFVDRLCWAAKTYGFHCHLVHHIRKGSNESDVPSKFDVKGAGEITDLVDNVCLMWRNKDKESRMKSGDFTKSADEDAAIIVCKQRHGEWEGGIKLWFDPKSTQYLGASDEMAQVIF